jgi:hypothetical protein
VLTRYALDFRLMTEQRIAILDASYSIFAADIPTSKKKTSSNGSDSHGSWTNNKNLSSGSSSSTSASSSLNSNQNPVDNLVMLQPIPNFEKVVTEIVAGESGNGVFSIDVGLICGVEAVARVGKALHDRLVVEPAKPSTAGQNSIRT